MFYFLQFILKNKAFVFEIELWSGYEENVLHINLVGNNEKKKWSSASQIHIPSACAIRTWYKNTIYIILAEWPVVSPLTLPF